MTESFEKEMSALRALGLETFVLRGSNILVEIQDPEEIKTKGGLIMATKSDHIKGNSVEAHRVEVGKVLMVGEGYWNETPTEHGTSFGFLPLAVKPGAIVLLPQYCIQKLSHFPGISRPTGNKLAMIKEDNIIAYYPTQEAYESAKAALNE